MFQTVNASYAGNPSLPSYLSTATERAIMALGPSRWFDARQSRGLVLDESGKVTAWVDRARGARYIPISSDKPGTTGTGDGRRVNFTGTPTKVLADEDASNALNLGTAYTFALLTRQTSAAFGGAPAGTMAGPDDFAFVWYDSGANGNLAFFTRGTANGASSAFANNDSSWHVHIASVDTTQGVAAERFSLRRDGVRVNNAATPVELANVPGARRIVLGGVGSAGQTYPFNGSLGVVLIIPDIALHVAGNEDKLALVESYLTAMIGQLP